ncbi:carbon-nitrogen hydrolase family protein [Rhizorhapis sp.]|uniref:carbon-nitrogen hydrolase family protein n=1 Tax=Rhizorhapis sp. TaxID=1968842 RepID=UPI002B47C2A7|nr:carbon-nitrogen hydrolase family protein [Rhizorhapis sp.]HKR17101.1 carbon-nitrogen hydrolase family protein [Rhizorhapis sp.]
MIAARQKARVATVQFEARTVASFADFAARVEYFTKLASEYEADFVVFPEFFTLALLSCQPPSLDVEVDIDRLTKLTPDLAALFRRLASDQNINIIAGTHISRDGNGIPRNICHIALRDGSLHIRQKVHATPNEAAFWGIEGGGSADAIETDCGAVGVLICYDSEFPELSRHLVDQGAKLLFVPFCTDSQPGYLRVRYCSQARAIENQCHVVLSGNCGNLQGVANMDLQYGVSAIFTPCDFPFPRDGIAGEATPNVEGMTIADLSLSDLDWAREKGSVRNLADRRPDLYASWR